MGGICTFVAGFTFDSNRKFAFQSWSVKAIVAIIFAALNIMSYATQWWAFTTILLMTAWQCGSVLFGASQMFNSARQEGSMAGCVVAFWAFGMTVTFLLNDFFPWKASTTQAPTTLFAYDTTGTGTGTGTTGTTTTAAETATPGLSFFYFGLISVAGAAWTAWGFANAAPELAQYSQIGQGTFM